MTYKTAVGNYINVFAEEDGGADIFVLLNEANYPPQYDEVDRISDTIWNLIEEGCFREEDYVAALDGLDLECLEMGFTVVIRQIPERFITFSKEYLEN